MEQMLNLCNQRIDAGLIESSGVALKNIFQKAADATLELKPSKSVPNRQSKAKNKKAKKAQKKWFDNDCLNMKALTNKMAGRKHRNPGNVSIQQQHKEIMKEYKILCRRKRAKFWFEEYNKLDLC